MSGQKRIINLKRLNFSVALLLLLGLTAGNFQGQARAAEPAQTYMNGISRDSLVSDGQTLVWEGYHSADPNPANTDIYAKDLASGREFVVADTDAEETGPEIDGNIVIWLEKTGSGQLRLLGKDLVTGRGFVVVEAQEPDALSNLSISGDEVLWVLSHEKRRDNSIFTRNIQTLAEPRLIFKENLPLTYSQTFYASIAGDYVFLQTGNEGYSECKFYIIKIDTPNPRLRKIAENSFPALCKFSWTVQGNLLIYGDLQTVLLTTYNLDSGEKTELLPYVYSDQPETLVKDVSNNSTAYAVTTDGRYIFWEPGTYHNLDLYAYDLSTKSAFKPYLGETPKDADNNRPVLARGVLYWEQTVEVNGEEVTSIKSRPLAGTLPASPRPEPPHDPAVFYYKETGHTLAEPFKTFWEQNGGLSVFGFPFTEQLVERSQENGEYYVVQYFERQRFEYHPEKEGTPYEVLLGLLGNTEATRRGLTVTGAFLAVPDAKKSGCKYFSAVNHAVCGKFYDYWRAHGLDLGDPGLSEREALALFGYPISEPFTDPDSGLQVQYFERARFELHPENAGTPYEVLLGRLAVNSLVERDWLNTKVQ